MSEKRPDPDALLAQVKEQEAREARGKLKLFFGAAAGVGKTYAMLEAARERQAEGIDVVVGYVETHGRAGDRGPPAGSGAASPAAHRVPGRHPAGVRPGRRPRPPPGPHPRGRARPHQCRWLPPRQALAGRPRAARGRHRRLHDPERPAPREPQRHRGQDHRGDRARDRPRFGPRGGRRGRADRPAPRRPPGAAPGGQGLRARAGGGGDSATSSARGT